MPDGKNPENPFGHKELRKLERNDPVRKWMLRLAIPLLAAGVLLQVFNSESNTEAPAATETLQTITSDKQPPPQP